MKKLEQCLIDYEKWEELEPRFPESTHMLMSSEIIDFTFDDMGDLIVIDQDYNKTLEQKIDKFYIPKSKLEQLQKFLNEVL